MNNNGRSLQAHVFGEFTINKHMRIRTKARDFRHLPILASWKKMIAAVSGRLFNLRSSLVTNSSMDEGNNAATSVFAEILDKRGTAHPECFAARTTQGWGIVDRKGVWRIADCHAEIGEVRRVTIDYESIAIALNNEDRWVAAVRHEVGGLWGGIKLEMRTGEEVSEFVFENEEALFSAISVQPVPSWHSAGQ